MCVERKYVNLHRINNRSIFDRRDLMNNLMNKCKG